MALERGGGNDDESEVERWEHVCEGGEGDWTEREDNEGGFSSIGWACARTAAGMMGNDMIAKSGARW